MKTCAVLLASGIYPLIIRYWLENLKTWEHKIDKFLSVDDYHEIPEFYKKIVQRVTYLRSLV